MSLSESEFQISGNNSTPCTSYNNSYFSTLWEGEEQESTTTFSHHKNNIEGNCHSTLRKNSKNAKSESGLCDKLHLQLSHLGKGTTWLGILLGQFCSGLLCLSSVTTVFLVDVNKVRLPNAQNFAFYLLLSLIFTSLLAFRRGERNLFPVLKLRGWKYFIVALADVEGNFLMLKAYQFTSLTSVQLLDCFKIPTVLLLSWLILRIRYKVSHIIGVFICLLGVSSLIWADVESGGKFIGTGKERFIGDMMSLGGAFLFGVSGVAQEFVVKNFDWVEFLGLIGLIGSFTSGLQALVLEYGVIVESAWTSEMMGLVGAYAFSQFLFYISSALVVKLSSVTALNLSLLSADFYSLLLAKQLFSYKFHALYFLSFVLVMIGVILFSVKPTSTAAHLYRSLLVREQMTISTDLELLASGPSFENSPYAHNSHSSTSNSKTKPTNCNCCQMIKLGENSVPKTQNHQGSIGNSKISKKPNDEGDIEFYRRKDEICGGGAYDLMISPNK